jgi:hypothetical protein
MSQQFANGYALLIGVTENQVARWALPDVAKDIAAVAGVLRSPERCAYPNANVKVVTGPEATRQGIMEGLDWLGQRIQAAGGGNATAVVYYTGHGWRDQAAGSPAYYLIPYDVRENAIRSRALRAEDFADAIAGLKPRRLLVVLDCCHAGGMGAKELAAGSGFTSAAIPVGLLMAGEAAVSAAAGSKGLELLSRGSGRAVLSSSQGEQPSYIRADRAMSIFTYHLIEALTGHAQPAEGATEVLVSDVMGHVWRRVPQSARADWNKDQQPDYQVSGNFPVALLLGGQGLSKGMAPPDPLALPAAPAPASVTNINTGGGAYIGGGVNMGGGTFAGRDLTVQGTGIAFGQDAQVQVEQGISGADLDRLFAPLMAAVDDAPPDMRDQATEVAQDLKQEAAKGKAASDSRMATLIDGLVALVPGAVSTVVTMFATPVLGAVVGPVTKFVLDKIQRK